MPKIRINTQSIKNRLKGYNEKPAESILEYIWNGFDAGADNVYIKYNFGQKADGVSFGYPDFEICDDGFGWDIDNIEETQLFLVSPKTINPNKSLPQGKDGVGRFTFFSFADKATWETVYKGKKYRLKLKAESLDDYSLEKDQVNLDINHGTRVFFNVTSDKLTESFLRNELIRAIKQEFCWLFKLYPQKNIYINNKKIDIEDYVFKEIRDEIKIDKFIFKLYLVQWKFKPTHEFSRYYFTNDKEESFTITTGLNYQSDDFHHSVYINSIFFNGVKSPNQLMEDDKNSLPLSTKKELQKKEIYRKVLDEIRRRLEEMRKPFLRELSKIKINEWRESLILPNVLEYGLKQVEYERIIQEVYVAVPQLFKNCSDEQRTLVLRFFSTLLSGENKDQILKILDQVYRLSDEDRKNLSELLERTTLSRITGTIKEIDERLNVLNILEEILLNSDINQYTKEVDHLQKVLDENFWIFGEGYRLFASTEGSIKNTLIKFKNEILRKDDEEIKTNSKKELDLFLTKCEHTTDLLDSVVVEIKRPSVKLKKKELDQIKEYMQTILSEPSCNGEKNRWTFYLIGCDYDDYIKKEIKTNKGWGEESQGLAFYDEEHHAKLYVRKWSDIINVEQKSRFKYLQDKLQIKLKDTDGKEVDELVKEATKKKE